MLDTLTTEELLRHCIQHGPMTEMEHVLFERLEAFADMQPFLDVLDNFDFCMTSPDELNGQLEHLIEQQSVVDELRTDKHELEQSLREARAELEELKC